jgi:hypothetical protein
MKALWHNAGMRRFHELPDPRELFPPTLEVLNISEASPYTPIFLKDLCTAKKDGHFPSPRRVEVYHLDPLKSNELFADKYQCPKPVTYVQDEFR